VLAFEGYALITEAENGVDEVDMEDNNPGVALVYYNLAKARRGYADEMCHRWEEVLDGERSLGSMDVVPTIKLCQIYAQPNANEMILIYDIEPNGKQKSLLVKSFHTDNLPSLVRE